MGYRYKHSATALNGVIHYIRFKYPDCDLLKTLHEGIHITQQHSRINLTGINEFMKKYRLSVGSNPSKVIDKNAYYIQQNFKPFAEYCKQNLK